MVRWTGLQYPGESKVSYGRAWDTRLAFRGKTCLPVSEIGATTIFSRMNSGERILTYRCKSFNRIHGHKARCPGVLRIIQRVGWGGSVRTNSAAAAVRCEEMEVRGCKGPDELWKSWPLKKAPREGHSRPTSYHLLGFYFLKSFLNLQFIRCFKSPEFKELFIFDASSDYSQPCSLWATRSWHDLYRDCPLN